MAQAFATARHVAPPLYAALAPPAAARARAFDVYSLAATAWAYASAKESAPVLTQALADVARERIDQFEPTGLVMTARAFVRSRHVDGDFLDAAAERLLHRVADLSPQELANTAWTYATAGHASTALFDAVGHVAAARVAEFKPQELANLGWAFAAADVPNTALFGAEGTFARACDAAEWHVRRPPPPAASLPPPAATLPAVDHVPVRASRRRGRVRCSSCCSGSSGVRNVTSPRGHRSLIACARCATWRSRGGARKRTTRASKRAWRRHYEGWGSRSRRAIRTNEHRIVRPRSPRSDTAILPRRRRRK